MAIEPPAERMMKSLRSAVVMIAFSEIENHPGPKGH
jgi:hypothetical protein